MSKHNHDDERRLTFGCPRCIELARMALRFEASLPDFGPDIASEPVSGDGERS